MSKTFSCYFKREPKNKKEIKGFYSFCGLTCCSPIGAAPGKGMRGFFRSIRRNQKKAAIRDGLAQYFCE